MIPLKSDNPRTSPAVVTAVLITLNILIFVYQFSLGPKADQRLVNAYGLIPARAELFLNPTPKTAVSLPQIVTPLVTSMFLHGGWLHVLGNMLFLWIFGGSVQDRRVPLVVFLFLHGVRSGLGPVSHAHKLGLKDSDDRRERSDFRGDGSVHCPLSEVAYPDSGSHRDYYLAAEIAGGPAARLLVRSAISKRRRVAGSHGSRRCSLVGSCRRIPSGRTARPGAPTATLQVRLTLDNCGRARPPSSPGDAPRQPIAGLTRPQRAAQVRSDLPHADSFPHRSSQSLGLVRQSQVIEHHGGSQHCAAGIGAILACDVRCGPVHRLKQRNLPGVDIARRRKPKPARQLRTQVASCPTS